MLSSRLFTCIAATAVAFLCLGTTEAALSRESLEVQGLANFPALQKLGGKNDGRLRSYLSRVSNSYRKAGYRDFARELAEASSLVVLFGKPELAESAAKLKKARTTLRDLKQALAKNNFVVLPKAGETLPDYFGIGAAFLGAADTALKNLTRHKNVANSLRNNHGMSWLTNRGDGRYTASSSLDGSLQSIDFSLAGAAANASITVSSIAIAGSVTINDGSQTSTGIIKTGPGTLVLSGTNTFTTSLNLAGGTLTLSNSGYLSDFKNGITLSGSGKLAIQLSGLWAIFPPNVEVPATFSHTDVILINSSSLIEGVEYPAGTRLLKFDGSADLLPEGVAILSTPTTISAAPSPTPSPSPSPTPSST